jgi:hypothetical protein
MAMVTRMRRALHGVIPSHFSDPLGLSIRIARSGSSEAYFAVWSAMLRLAACPLDVVLSVPERRLYHDAPPPSKPIILVCGAPRSGTTLVSQVLMRSLPVAYTNNLMELFSRSPITANKLFRNQIANESIGFRSYYGKTTTWRGPNDALRLWDRWLGSDRTAVAPELTFASREAMRRFFGAFQEAFGLPIVNKNNNLNVVADRVASALPTSHFICMDRDPLHLAQSLLLARRHIHGDDDVAYGVKGNWAELAKAAGGGAIADACAQALFHRDVSAEQEKRVGPERFWRIEYESFCHDPVALVERVAAQILHCDVDGEELRRTIPRFTPSSRQSISDVEFRALGEAMAACVAARREGGRAARSSDRPCPHPDVAV